MSKNTKIAQPPKAILFDWDNTLVASWPIIQKALQETMEAMGQPVWDLDEVRRRSQASASEAFPELFGERAKEALEIYYQAFARVHMELLSPMPFALELLEKIQNTMPQTFLGVVSNKRADLLRKEVKHLGWENIFAKLVGAGEAHRDKPDSAPVHLALKGTLNPSPDVWFVGDSAVDVLCAQNSGCVSILVRPKEWPKTAFAGQEVFPDFSFANCRDFASKMLFA